MYIYIYIYKYYSNLLVVLVSSVFLSMQGTIQTRRQKALTQYVIL